MTKKLNAAFDQTQRHPVAAPARKIGGLIGTMLVCGQFAACSSEVPEIRATEAVAARVPTKTASDTCFTFERFGHVVMHHCNTTHDSDLPGASIAEYEKGIAREMTSPATREESESAPKPR